MTDNISYYIINFSSYLDNTLCAIKCDHFYSFVTSFSNDNLVC